LARALCACLESIPEFDPVDPEKLKFTRLVHEADQKDIDERLKELASSQKTYKKKAKTAKAKKDDAVLIDFVGTVDGEPFDGGAMEGHQLVLGSGKLSKFKARKIAKLMMTSPRSSAWKTQTRSRPPLRSPMRAS